MHPKQREIIDLINNYQLADAFAALDKLVLKNPVYSLLKKTYLAGKTDVDFIDRLLVFAQNLDLKVNPTMPDHKAHLKKLIQRGEIGRAIEELCDATEENGQRRLNNNLLNLSGRYYRVETSKRQGVITDASYNTQMARLQESLNYYLDEEYEPSGDFEFKPIKKEKHEPSVQNKPDQQGKPSAQEEESSSKKVFISYSTKDRKVADQLKARLEDEDIQVTIDYQDFIIGEDLMDSIEKHLRANGIVISLISENSLKSKWVAEESMIMFYTERMTDRLFIPTFLDNFLFELSFVGEALAEIHEKIQAIRGEIDIRNKNNWPIEDLAPDLDFYEKLASNLPSIVKKFRARLAVNLTPTEFDKGVDLILKRIENIST